MRRVAARPWKTFARSDTPSAGEISELESITVSGDLLRSTFRVNIQCSDPEERSQQACGLQFSATAGCSFIEGFNNERPHEALDSACTPDCRTLDYPLHDKTIIVTRCGRICLGENRPSGRTISLKRVMRSQKEFLSRPGDHAADSSSTELQTSSSGPSKPL